MSNQKEIEIMPLEESDRGVAAYLMTYSCLSELGEYVKKIEIGGLAIKSGIIIKKFYKAVSDKKIIGLISLSDTRSGYMELEYSNFKKQFGFIKAKKVYSAFENIFSMKNVPDGCGYITYPIFPANGDDSVIRLLFEYVFSLKKYDKYYMYIPSKDLIRRSTLEDFGFTIFKRYNIEKNPQTNDEENGYLLMEYCNKNTPV